MPLMEPESSLLYSQEPTIRTFPGSDASPHLPILFP